LDEPEALGLLALISSQVQRARSVAISWRQLCSWPMSFTGSPVDTEVRQFGWTSLRR
jgi:hypothetical protein